MLKGRKEKAVERAMKEQQRLLEEERRRDRRIRQRRRGRTLGCLVSLLFLGTAAFLGWRFLKVWQDPVRRMVLLYQCPEEVASYVAIEPEAKEFAVNYHDYADREDPIDLSKDLRADRWPHLIQWDKRWAYRWYGDGYLGITGCGPTALSIVLTGLGAGEQWNPWAVASWAQNRGYYVDGIGTAWSMMTEGASRFGLSASELELSVQALKDAILDQEPVIASMLPGDFTKEGHFIVITGINEDGTLSVIDPNSRIRTKKNWDIDVILRQCAALWAYQKNS